MAATSVTNVQVRKNGHDFVYADYVGTSDDTKPTTGVFNGSTYLEAVYEDGEFTGTWNIYIFSGRYMHWNKFATWEV